jgi:hypothetical protein
MAMACLQLPYTDSLFFIATIRSCPTLMIEVYQYHFDRLEQVAVLAKHGDEGRGLKKTT